LSLSLFAAGLMSVPSWAQTKSPLVKPKAGGPHTVVCRGTGVGDNIACVPTGAITCSGTTTDQDCIYPSLGGRAECFPDFYGGAVCSGTNSRVNEVNCGRIPSLLPGAPSYVRDATCTWTNSNPLEVNSPITFVDTAVGSSTVQTLSIKGLIEPGGGYPIQTVSIVSPSPIPVTLENDTCTGTSLNAGNTCTVDLRFAPTALGLRSGTIEIIHDEYDSNSQSTARSLFVPMSGRGIGGVSVAVTGPREIVFPATITDEESTQVVDIQASGAAPITFTGATATGGPYRIVNDGCLGGPFNPPYACKVTVGFTPQAPVAYSGTFSLYHSGGVLDIPIRAGGAPGGPIMALSPQSWTYAPRELPSGVFGSAQTALERKRFTATNTGTGSFKFGQIVVPAGFAVADTSCGAGVAPGASCTLDIDFRPDREGMRGGAVKLIGSKSQPAATAQVIGMGRPAEECAP
jgi:hypothetical protein